MGTTMVDPEILGGYGEGMAVCDEQTPSWLSAQP